MDVGFKWMDSQPISSLLSTFPSIFHDFGHFGVVCGGLMLFPEGPGTLLDCPEGPGTPSEDVGALGDSVMMV